MNRIFRAIISEHMMVSLRLLPNLMPAETKTRKIFWTCRILAFLAVTDTQNEWLAIVYTAKKWLVTVCAPNARLMSFFCVLPASPVPLSSTAIDVIALCWLFREIPIKFLYYYLSSAPSSTSRFLLCPPLLKHVPFVSVCWYIFFLFFFSSASL